MKTRRALLAVGLLGAALTPVLASGSPAVPGRSVRTAPGDGIQSRAYLHSYNLPSHGVALEGFSPVSYFDAGRAERGEAVFSVTHEGVSYHLTSAEQAAKFARDPQRYVPAYGGWCAFGMAVEDKFPVDPRVFKIVDGRLLLFLKNPGVDALELWNGGDERELLRKADAHWRRVQG